MSNGDQLALYSTSQLPALFKADENSKLIALKIKKEANNTALHVIYVQKQDAALSFCALVTVTEWDGKSDREEFFIEAENIEQLIEKLQRFDEINSFVFVQSDQELTIETVNIAPQALCCMLFPELGVLHAGITESALLALKNSSLAYLDRLETLAEKR